MSLTPIVALLQRHLRVSVVVALTAAALAGGVVAVYAVPAHAQFAKPDAVRFQLIGDEPIASPDGRQLLTNWKVEVLRDRKSDQCYVAILLGNAMSITGPSTCPN
jgi:hypothetical protein